VIDTQEMLVLVSKSQLRSAFISQELTNYMDKVIEDFFSNGIRDYSVVITDETYETRIWLGPVTFVNHDCEANASIVSVAIVKGHCRIIKLKLKKI